MNKKILIRAILIIFIAINFFGCSSQIKKVCFKKNDSFFIKFNEIENLKSFKKVFYFDYDSDKIYKKDLDTLSKHAKILNFNKKLVIFLHGHTDNRGSSKYNIILGKHRANKIKNILLDLKVDPKQIKIFSYGKSKPVIKGNFESAWKLNRRVEMFYSNN